MKSIVIYYSKSGNTKGFAEIMAKKLQSEMLPLNLMEKKGRGTKTDRDRENEYLKNALESSRNADLVIIGTPTNFKKAVSKVIRFTKEMDAKNVGLFCTYNTQTGTTLTDLEAILKEKNINIIGSIEFGGLIKGYFKELNPHALQRFVGKAEKFVESCINQIK